jgi:hypothetical protein
VAGRGAGKTRAGACWIHRRVDQGTMKLGFLIAPTANDIRDVMVEGPSGLLDVVRLKNAIAIKAQADSLSCHGRIDLVRLDPSAVGRSSLGPAAYGEYARVFGSRIVARWPHHQVLDGLDTIELLLDTGYLTMHPRGTRLLDAFRNYCRKRQRGEWIDFQDDGHPQEDLIDALRGGIRDALPGGHAPALELNRVHASQLF